MKYFFLLTKKKVLYDIYYDSRYLFCCSYAHNVAPKGKYIAFVSTEAETDQPEEELKPGIELLGTVDEIFIDVYDRYEPTNSDENDNYFISTVSACVFSLCDHFSVLSLPNFKGVITDCKAPKTCLCNTSFVVVQYENVTVTPQSAPSTAHGGGNSGSETSFSGANCECPTACIITKFSQF